MSRVQTGAVILNYLNPLWDGYCADPFILRAGDFYYCYGTGGGDASQDDGRQFVLLRSSDLSNWEFLGGALEPMEGFEGCHHWAPEVCERDGRFWMYFSCNSLGQDETTQQLRVAVAESPTGPFRVVKPLLLPDEGFCIDPSPFHDPRSGRWFLYYARDFLSNGRVGTGTAVVELGEDMVSTLGEPKTVVRASGDWQVYERNRSIYGRLVEAWHTVEGPCVVFHEERYVCFYAGGNWQNSGYGVSFAVSDSPVGPWVDEHSEGGAVVLKGNDHTIGPGHNSVVTAPDGETLLCVYHAWNAEGTKRQLCLDPIRWTPDGPQVTPTRGPQSMELSG